MHVLVVEDDPQVSAALALVLQRHGHGCTRVSRGADALLRHREADAVLLDLGLVDGDGFTVLRELREVSDVPVLVVTARGDERSVVRGLHLGADDYLVKPVRMNELLARLAVATGRRRRPVSAPPASTATVGDLVVDLAARTVSRNGAGLHLTRKEFDILACLAARSGEAVSRPVILDEVWGDTLAGSSRAFDVHLASLRSKLGPPDVITTVRGFGYRLGVGEGA